jgi:ubiquitin carboxyl-terminal hydrolase 8
MNTCLQLLSFCYELIELSNNVYPVIQNKNNTTSVGVSESKLFLEWIELHKLMWNTPENTKLIVSPNKFVYYVQELAKIKENNIFTGWNQNDMPEFLLFLIDSMHNSISRGINMKISGTPENEKDNMACKCYSMMKTVYSKEYSEIMELFYGISISHIDSKEGKSYTTNPEFFFILDLPIPEKPNPTLIDCFDEYTRLEVLDGENSWLNETTNQKESVRKYITFWTFPKILVISLKRFTQQGRNKRQELVNFPIEKLDLSSYVEGYKNKKYIYDIFGIANHYGGSGQGGHYTAIVKNSKNEWLHFNDTHVDIIDESKIITNNAYCLFFRMR